MTLSDDDLSRAVSHALRHEPWTYGLELDAGGWASVDHLISALREKAGDWERVDSAALEQMIANATRRRHEFDRGRIRALYGHSVSGVALGSCHHLFGSPPARLGTRFAKAAQT